MGYNSEYAHSHGHVIVDIETVGLPNAADFLEPPQPDARLKDPEKIAADIGEGGSKAGRPALDALLARRGVEIVTFRDWQKIEAAEIQRARAGSPREKFVAIEEMIRAKG